MLLDARAHRHLNRRDTGPGPCTATGVTPAGNGYRRQGSRSSRGRCAQIKPSTFDVDAPHASSRSLRFSTIHLHDTAVQSHADRGVIRNDGFNSRAVVSILSWRLSAW